jgi:hypothetical protein
LFCKGDKAYGDALGNIKVYNLTKVLGNHCSIPNKMGIKKLDYLDYDILGNLFEDVIMFNYFYFCLSQLKAGVNFRDIKKLLYIYGYPDRDYDIKRHALVTTFHRDAYDMFNVFCVNIVTKSFTDVIEVSANY